MIYSAPHEQILDGLTLHTTHIFTTKHSILQESAENYTISQS